MSSSPTRPIIAGSMYAKIQQLEGQVAELELKVNVLGGYIEHMVGPAINAARLRNMPQNPEIPRAEKQ